MARNLVRRLKLLGREVQHWLAQGLFLLSPRREFESVQWSHHNLGATLPIAIANKNTREKHYVETTPLQIT